MSRDMVVDSQRLDGALAATADAIRRKSRTLAAIPFDMDDGFSDAVDDIPMTTGVGDWSYVTRWMSTFSVPAKAAPLPETITIDASSWANDRKVFVFPASLNAELGYRHIVVRHSKAVNLSLSNLFQNYYPPRDSPCTITFEDGVSLANVSGALAYIGYNSNAPYPEIYGEIDLGNLTDAMTPSTDWCLLVGHIEFKHNSCTMEQKLSLRLRSTSVGLVALANALHEGTSGKLTLASSNKSLADGTMGTYEWIDEEQCHVFTRDANGGTTLTRFITNVKGWTIAT